MTTLSYFWVNLPPTPASRCDVKGKIRPKDDSDWLPRRMNDRAEQQQCVQCAGPFDLLVRPHLPKNSHPSTAIAARPDLLPVPVDCCITHGFVMPRNRPASKLVVSTSVWSHSVSGAPIKRRQRETSWTIALRKSRTYNRASLQEAVTGP